jgi:trehalose 6-phosphate phosphatase
MSAVARIPGPLPPELLGRLAAGPGLLLCLDYDGTLAEITADRANARPFAGVHRELKRLRSRDKITVAIVTGRTIAEVKRLLGIDDGLIFSGVHGLEFDWGDGKASFVPEAFGPAPELATVREWLAGNVPEGSGFHIEDKGFAVGLHYRLANVGEAQAVCARLEHFIASETRQLKVVHLKMLAEVMPRVASKARALLALRPHVPSSYVTAYFGDDTTDEDAFRVLAPGDVAVLVGEERKTLAHFRVSHPADVVRELRAL